MAVAVVVVIAAVGVVALVANGSKSTEATSTGVPSTSPATTLPLGPVGAGTQLQADRGTTVYSDNFTDPGSGWPTAPALSDTGTTYTYGAGGYLVRGQGNIHHFAYPSYDVPVAQLGTSTTATQTVGAATGSGFGVVCYRGKGTANIRYEFLLLTDRRWFVELGKGDGTTPSILKEGTAPVGPGSAPVTVTGMCATEADGQTNRLVMFVNGTSVTDLTDTAVGMPDTGWLAGLVIGSRVPGTATVTFSQFTERDLTR